ncbi:hypothetical protein RYX36_021698 [Vicia faba]
MKVMKIEDWESPFVILPIFKNEDEDEGFHAHGWSVRSLSGETVMDMRPVRQRQLLAIQISSDGASNAQDCNMVDE